MALRITGSHLRTLLALVLWVFAALGCATQSPIPLRILDSSEHHVMNGIKLMQRGRLEHALREFDLALSQDPDCSTAHRGKALIFGMSRDFEKAFTELHKAIRHTAPDDLRGSIHKSLNSCCRRSVPSSLMTKQMEEIPFSARSHIAHFLNEYFVMGVSYKDGHGFHNKVEALDASLEASHAFIEEATAKVHFAGELERVTPETVYARGLVFDEGLSRGEVAGLLVRELEIHELLGKNPTEGRSGNEKALKGELAEHPLKNDILIVLDLGLAGLRPSEDGLFSPDKTTIRAEYAELLADILERSQGNDKSFHEDLPILTLEDVPLSSRHLKSVIRCVEAGLLEARDGQFRPEDPVTGLEAIKGVFRLRDLIVSND